MAQERAVAASETYEVRLATPSDHERFLALYEDVWDRSRSEAWFDWRFGATPYSPEVEMVVAERDGDLVGAELLLPMPLSVGGERVVARQPVDWIVHPDHRQRGVFTRMTELLLATYGDRTDLLFNFPTDALLPGLEKFDWSTVSRQSTRYRIQDLRSVTGSEASDSPGLRLVNRFGASAIRAGLGAADRLTQTPSGVSVERVDGPATDAITTVYEETRPDDVHVPREAPFVDWRFANPRWDVATYVARRDGHPTATVVVATAAKPHATVAYLLDVEPMTTVPERAPAFAAALDAALADFDGVDAVQAPTDPYPRVLRRRGFLCDDNPLLSRFSTPATHVVKVVGNAEDVGDGVFDGERWQLMLGDRDIE